MKVISSLFTIILLSSLTLSAQVDEKDVVPKEYSLELGYRYISSSKFENQASMGTTILLDYAWQLSGFNRKNASYISVPLGYTILRPDTEGDSKMSILSYGWTVRHELGREKKVIPFFGYSLLFNQLRQQDVDGSIFGHQTKFDLGINLNNTGKVRYFTKFEYSYTRYPRWGHDKSYTMHTWELKVGARF